MRNLEIKVDELKELNLDLKEFPEVNITIELPGPHSVYVYWIDGEVWFNWIENNQ